MEKLGHRMPRSGKLGDALSITPRSQCLIALLKCLLPSLSCLLPGTIIVCCSFVLFVVPTLVDYLYMEYNYCFASYFPAGGHYSQSAEICPILWPLNEKLSGLLSQDGSPEGHKARGHPQLPPGWLQ